MAGRRPGADVRGGFRGFPVLFQPFRRVPHQADLSDSAVEKRPDARAVAESRSGRPHRGRAEPLGREECPRNRSPQGERALPKGVLGQRVARDQDADLHVAGLYRDAARRRDRGQGGQPQVPRALGEEYRPADSHCRRFGGNIETRGRGAGSREGVFRRRGAGPRDRRFARDGRRPSPDRHSGRQSARPAARSGNGRPPPHRSGHNEPAQQLDQNTGARAERPGSASWICSTACWSR